MTDERSYPTMFQTLAVAQIVFTATEQSGMGAVAPTAVRLLVDGSPVDVPRADGSLDSSELERADFRVRELDTPGYPADELYDVQEGDGNFVWVFNPSMVLSKGTPLQLPTVPVLPEEPLSGYWERHLLWLTNNNVDVWRFAEKNLPV